MLLSEFMSLILFLASVGVYAWKAGRHTWWFIATLVVLGIFIILNITLYASDYFTGEGINDAVLYTLTNSLTGAGISKEVETKLFSPFFSTKPNGQGIGLIFIREVLIKHGCTFSLRTYPDKLTRFRIRF